MINKQKLIECCLLLIRRKNKMDNNIIRFILMGILLCRNIRMFFNSLIIVGYM